MLEHETDISILSAWRILWGTEQHQWGKAVVSGHISLEQCNDCRSVDSVEWAQGKPIVGSATLFIAISEVKTID